MDAKTATMNNCECVCVWSCGGFFLQATHCIYNNDTEGGTGAAALYFIYILMM